MANGDHGNVLVLGQGSVDCILSGGQADPEPGFSKHCICAPVAPKVCKYGAVCDCGANNVVLGKEYFGPPPGDGSETSTVSQMETIGDVLVLGQGSVDCFRSGGQADPEPGFSKHCICEADSPLIM